MSRASHIQPSFNTGELSPKLSGRVDLQRYASSLSRMDNFFPTVGGSAVKRPGTRFIAKPMLVDSKLIPFQVSRDTAYVVEHGTDGLCRVLRAGAVKGLVTNTAFTIDAITVGDPTVFNVTGNHEWLNGDTVIFQGLGGSLGPRINGRTFEITVVDPDEFSIDFDSTGLTTNLAGTISRVYEFRTPFTDGRTLSWEQSVDVMFLAGRFARPQKLLRFGDSDWVMTDYESLKLDPPVLLSAVTLANPGVFTTTRPHSLAVGDIVIFMRTQGMIEINGRQFRVATVPTELTFTVEDRATGTDLNTTGFHAFGGGGKVAHTGYVQKVRTWGYPPFLPENSDVASRVVCSVEAKGATGKLFSNRGIFHGSMVGTRLRLAALPATTLTKWFNRTDFNDVGYFKDRPDGSGVINPGEHVFHERNVYELINKNGNALTGESPPVHDGEGERQTDHRYTWEYVNSGEGFVEITDTTADGHEATVTVRRRLPRSTTHFFTSTTLALSGTGATSNTADPVQITTAGNHNLTDGDQVLLYGFTGATELNGLVVFADVTGATTFDAYYDAAFTRGVDGINVGANGEWAHFNNATERWAISWDEGNVDIEPTSGAPVAVALFENRLWWAGADAPSGRQTLWASVSGDYDDHDRTDLLTGGLVFQMNDGQSDTIAWMKARRALVFATREAEYVAAGRNPDEPISVENPLKIERMTSHGAWRSYSQPLQVGSSLLFATRNGKSVREFTFDTYNSDEYKAHDVTLLSDHLLADDGLGVFRLMYFFVREPMVWISRGSHYLMAGVFDRTQDVVGWCRVTFGGLFGGTQAPIVWDAAVTPDFGGDTDLLWVIVQRDADGGDGSIEIMEPPFEEGGDLATDAFYVDSGLRYSGAATNELFGLSHLIGETVQVFGGSVTESTFMGTFVVDSAGRVTLPVNVTSAVVGLPYVATLETNRLEVGGGDGPAQGKTKNIRSLVLRLVNTGAGLFYSAFPFLKRDKLAMRSDGEQTARTAVSLFNGDTRELELPGDASASEGRVRVTHEQPLPCTIAAVMIQAQTEDD